MCEIAKQSQTARGPGGVELDHSEIGGRDGVADAEPGGFEVGAFGGVEGYRVVGGGAGHGQELDAPAGLAGGGAEEGLEVSERGAGPSRSRSGSRPPGSTRPMPRTFRSKYFRLPEGTSSRSGISLGGSSTTTPKVFWLTRHLPHVAESVGVDHAEPDAVGVAVLAGQRHGLLIQVHAGDLARLAADQGVQAEPAGVAAGIEDRSIRAEPRQVAAVVALIAEEAGLVPFLEVDPVANAVLLDGDARRKLGTGQRAGPGSPPEARRARRPEPGSAASPGGWSRARESGRCAGTCPG